MADNPLHALHEQAEASFLPFGPDIDIVESFGEVEAEYAAIRKAAALMDSPHRSVVVLTGKDRLAFLHNLVTQDVKTLSAGRGAYAFMLNVKGRIVLDMRILHAEDATLLEVDARLAADLAQSLEKYRFAEDVKILDARDQLARLTVLGPDAAKLLGETADFAAPLPTEPLSHVRRSMHKTNVTIFRDDQCGEPQYELIVPRDRLVALWQVLHEAHPGDHEQHPGMRAVGWSAFNTARIEAGTPLLGIDFTDQHVPMETSHWYARAVAVSKGCYVGQEIVARMHAHNAVARLLVGFRVAGDQLPVAGAAIQSEAAQVGIVTSSCMSPMLGYAPIAMGYVRRADAQNGRQVRMAVNGQSAAAEVSPLPFWKKM